MSIERKIAWCDWIGGMIIGLMPLLAHGVLWIGTKGQAGWSDNWAPDILFVTISNSGLAAISVFGRRLADVGGPLKPGRRIVWGMTLASFALASMLYGADVTGMGNSHTWQVALFLMIFSAICSLIFEFDLAGVKADAASG